MKKFFKVLNEATVDALVSVVMFFVNNLVNFANILNTILPYLMYFIGMYVMYKRERFVADLELLIPILFMITIYYLKSAANKLGKGITVPIPERRFTEVDEDGEVSIEQSRVQELILYVADLEDWLQRKGIL